ncbi:RDD family protein [Mucilaginibacter sp.]|uniref:RDD family protein n=1 Tax=Mucilaginibacter sp. TaxID=1882438 RepID=UPI003D096CC1
MEPDKTTPLQPADTNTYQLVINGKPEGPFTIEQLRSFNIKPGDFLRTAQMDDYKEAHEIAELRQYLGFSKEALIPQYFGNFDQRLLASALDWFFVAGAGIILTFLAVFLIDDKALRLEIAIGMLAVIPLAKLIYHVVMESSVKQATYGKQLLKIRVCDLQGERISTAKAIGRNTAKALSTIILFTGYLLSFFNKQQQCLHDMIADTLVVKDRLF